MAAQLRIVDCRTALYCNRLKDKMFIKSTLQQFALLSTCHYKNTGLNLLYKENKIFLTNSTLDKIMPGN